MVKVIVILTRPFLLQCVSYRTRYCRLNHFITGLRKKRNTINEEGTGFGWINKNDY